MTTMSSTPTAAPALLAELSPFGRPRLRADIPVLWRASDVIQIGDDITLTSITRSHVAWLSTLDGTRTPAELERMLTIPPDQARRVLRGLLAAGALDDADRVAESVRWAGPPDRADAHRRFSSALATYRDLDTAHAVTRRRERMRVGVIGNGRIAEEIVEALDAGGLAVDDDRADLFVLADAVHPSVPAHFDDPRMRHPHLHVGVYAEWATVGPLVVPGSTSCLRCQHLHRRDADPSWPLVSVQWSHWLSGLSIRPVDPLLARFAADWATLIVRAWIDLPDDRTAWAERAVDLRLPLVDPQHRRCPPHPLCGCRWALD